MENIRIEGERAPQNEVQTGKRVRWRRDLFESTDPVDWGFKDPKSVEVAYVAENDGFWKGFRTVYFKQPLANPKPFSDCNCAFEHLLEYI